MRLHVGVVAAKEFLAAVNGQLLDHVHVFTAAVPAFARITLGILVCQDAALGLADGAADEVLAGDEFDIVLLPALLAADGLGHGGIGYGNAGIHLVHAAGVAAALELRAEEFLRHRFRQRLVRASRKRHDVRVIVPACHLCALHITEQRGLNAGVPVRRDAHADAGGTNEQPRVRIALEHAAGDALRVVRIVHALAIIRADVLHCIAFAAEMLHDSVLQFPAAVVRSRDDAFL